MQKAEMKLVRFGDSDVIATSGGPLTLLVSNLADGTNGNILFTIEGKNYSPDSSLATNDVNSLYNRFVALELRSIENAASMGLFLDDNDDCPTALNVLVGSEAEGYDGSFSAYNGTYTWKYHNTDGNTGYFFVKNSN